MSDLVDLSSLPPPEVVEDISYPDLSVQIKAEIKGRFGAVGVDWDVDGLEADGAVIQAENSAYREIALRTRINHVAQQGYLYFAEGSNADQLASWLGVFRLDGESDERLKERYRLATIGGSTGGPAERFRKIVLDTSVDVRDVAVWTERLDPTIHIAVLSSVGNGEPSTTLLNAVEAALLEPSVRLVNDRFNVQSAVRKTVDVTLSVRIAESALDNVSNTVEETVQALWVKQKLLGLDMTQAFLISAASSVEGITNVSVVSPAEDVVASENEAIAIGLLTVDTIGRGR
ncbi:MAG: baseplate J/gp47 family protein [Roseibium sp.]